MALDAAKKIKKHFGDLVKFKEYTLDSEEGRSFYVTGSTNVFVNGELLSLDVWLDYEMFKDFVMSKIGKEKDSVKKNEFTRHPKYDVVIIGGGRLG